MSNIVGAQLLDQLMMTRVDQVVDTYPLILQYTTKHATRAPSADVAYHREVLHILQPLSIFLLSTPCLPSNLSLSPVLPPFSRLQYLSLSLSLSLACATCEPQRQGGQNSARLTGVWSAILEGEASDQHGGGGLRAIGLAQAGAPPPCKAVAASG